MDALNTGLLLFVIGAIATVGWFLLRKFWEFDKTITKDIGEIKGDIGTVKTDLGHVKESQSRMGRRQTEFITRIGKVEGDLSEHLVSPHCEDESDPEEDP
jgi:hypothetical protein